MPYCPACDRQVEQWAPGPGDRPDARCPGCNALERHRLLAYLIRAVATERRVARILDLAPHKQIRRVLRNAFPRAAYIGMDRFEPQRAIDLLGDITRLPIATDSVDLLLCYHVLEHVPDDRAAMRQLARVLHPRSLGLLQVPYRRHGPTDEQPDLPPEERAVRFGQADHVRHYGVDFDDRLRTSGLAVDRREPSTLLSTTTLQLIGAATREPVWLIRPDTEAATAGVWSGTVPEFEAWLERTHSSPPEQQTGEVARGEPDPASSGGVGVRMLRRLGRR